MAVSCRRLSESSGRRSGRLANPSRVKNSDRQPAVRSPGISSSILACSLRLKSINPIDISHSTSPLQIGDQLVALGVHIGRDMVRDLAGRMTQADALVKCGCPQEGRATLL